MNQLHMDMAEQAITNHVPLTLGPEHHHHQVLNHPKIRASTDEIRQRKDSVRGDLNKNY